jgi:hypothetical protein
MLTLPADMVALLASFAPLFSRRVWRYVPVLVVSALPALGDPSPVLEHVHTARQTARSGTRGAASFNELALRKRHIFVAAAHRPLPARRHWYGCPCRPRTHSDHFWPCRRGL